jgi:hypothetical protein
MLRITLGKRNRVDRLNLGWLATTRIDLKMYDVVADTLTKLDLMGIYSCMATYLKELNTNRQIYLNTTINQTINQTGILISNLEPGARGSLIAIFIFAPL